MAIVKRPARVPVTDPRYGGPVLLNPGGPGGRGTEHVLGGSALQARIDAAYSYGSDSYVSDNPDSRYFDLIGFDPRGVGASTPWHTCYNTTDQVTENSGRFENPGDIDALWQDSVQYSKNCVWDPVKNPEGSKIARFASTAMVARDLVEFVERHEEWREKQVNKTDTASVKRLSWQRGEEPIMFIGFSYGTILGATLAAMQPHRVKRFYLNGVVSADHYYNGDLTLGLASSDQVVDDFFASCTRSGPNTCLFWNGTSVNETYQRVLDVIDDLNGNKSANLPDLLAGNITAGYLAVSKILANVNSDPPKIWPIVAYLLDRLHSSSIILSQDYARALRKEQASNSSTKLDPYDPSMGSLMESESIIMIGSGDSSKRMSQEDYVRGPLKAIRRVARWEGWHWIEGWQASMSWPFTFGWRFAGEHAVASNVTAHPILFASMLRDGVTSIEAAKVMVSRFKDARLLVVDGHGHCTAAEPSLCAAKALRHYFQTGELPNTDQHCLPVWQPFNEGRDEDLVNMTREDASLLGALKGWGAD